MISFSSFLYVIRLLRCSKTRISFYKGLENVSKSLSLRKTTKKEIGHEFYYEDYFTFSCRIRLHFVFTLHVK